MELLPVAILAGGLATRLRPATERVPKAMIRVAGRPFIEWQLEYLREQGISRVVLCTGHLSEQIEAAVGDGATFGLQIRYSHDGPRLLGTGGAIRQALPLLGSDFFILYGDSYLPIDFRAVQRAYVQGARPGLMTVLRNDDRWDKSNVEFRDGVLVEYNKRQTRPGMKHIDYGLGILSADILRRCAAEAAFDLADLYHRLSLEHQLVGHEVQQRFYEIGSPTGLAETETYLRSRMGGA